ncbi:archaeosortase D [Methanotorris igneus]|uniref:Exosortase EpsH-related protein n=1 Tax=Methanotorris igneus (strain DSM 5666 / JCM 11834 / Kol 5) TaxID=880724 RepID=F6BDE9_METIK|nr:archaeosortase D [Methanotorris igneus]AEF96510.1 hypothetical protein Metig_0967 [Methanotorris igneus Kol 5]
MRDNKKYLLNFFVLLILIYLFLKNFEMEIAKLLSFVVGNILNIPYFENNLIYNGKVFSITSACTCLFELALFLSYVFATPKAPLKYKLAYVIFGILIINITNISRIIFILKNSNLADYHLIHDAISFIIFPVTLILNTIWVKILLKIKVVKI